MHVLMLLLMMLTMLMLMPLMQSVDEIKRLIEEARHVGVGAPGYVNPVETDEYIDDAMDNM